MKTIKINETTYRELTDVARLPFSPTGERLPDGNWLIQVEDDTYGQIQKERSSGEADDHIVRRLVQLIGRIAKSAR